MSDASNVLRPDLSFASALKAMAGTFRRGWKGLLVTAVVLKLVILLLGVAVGGVALSYVMRQTGRSAVTNTDIANLLLGPTGILLVFLAVSIALFLVLAEQAALMVVAALLAFRPELSAGTLMRVVVGALQRIARMAALLVALVLIVVLPVVAVIGLVYRKVLGAHDINFYLSSRPPAFLAVAAFAAALLVGAAVLLLVLYVRWSVAVPIVLFRAAHPFQALRHSRQWVRGVGWRVGVLLFGWHFATVVLSIALFQAYRAGARSMLTGDKSGFAVALTEVVLALLGSAVVTALISFVTWTGHALLVLRLYTVLGHRAGVVAAERLEVPEVPFDLAAGTSGFAARAAAAALTVVVAAALVLAGLIGARLAGERHVEITAHRGASHVAPENTLAAISKAIEVGADWAEIDVQRTADGVVVVLHDRDLMRMGGDPRRLSELTLEELESIDVGTKFSKEFAGEKVPTLQQTIDLARGKIRLNIELKYYGPDPELAPQVARMIREARFEKQCFLASLDYPSLEVAKRENPDVLTTAIVTAKMGDVTQLPVDQLSVGAATVSFDFLRSVRKTGKTLHVWTIDDPDKALLLIGRGVNNIITNDPAAMVKARARWEALPKEQRLLFATRMLLKLGHENDDDVIQQDAEL